MDSVEPNKKFISLKKTLLIYVVLISTLVTTIVTMLTFYFEYNQEVRLLKNNINQIKDSYQQSIASALWNLDSEQADLMLKGILTISEVISIKITAPDGNIVTSMDKFNHGKVKNIFTEEIALKYQDKNFNQELGILSITVSKSLIIDKLFVKLINLLALQGTKTFLVSFILLYLFSLIVTKKLRKIYVFLKAIKIKSSDKPLLLKLGWHSNAVQNEIDYLVSTLNEFVQSTHRDIREITKLKEDAQAAELIKKQFISKMSHELKTPLSSILGFNDILKSSSLTEKQKQYLQMQSDACNTLSNLVADVLDFSKLEDGELNLICTEFNLKELVVQFASDFKTMIDDHKVQYKVEYDPNSSELFFGDRTKIFRILTNIISNAIKYTIDGSVTVSVTNTVSSGKKGNIEIKVQDTGQGISEENLAVIFQPFGQVGEDDHLNLKGTGLGINIAKELIECHGGEVNLNSTKGAGTTFAFTLQLDISKENQAEIIDIKEVTKKMELKVLVVEDCESIRLLLSTLLKSYNVSVILASNGREGLEKYKDGKFDFVLMDIQMPKMNGYQCAVQMRKWEKDNSFASIPIFALSAFSSNDQIEMCKNSGMSAHFSKPANKAVLNKILCTFNELDKVA